MCELLGKMRAAHRVGVPLVGLQTADQSATIESLRELSPESPMFVWDLINGFQPLNEAACADTSGINGSCAGNVLEAMKKVGSAPAESVVVVKMANHFFGVPPVVQQISNLRDVLKGNGRMLVLLGADMSGLPVELKHDVAVFEESRPNDVQLGAIVDDIVESASEAHEGFTVGDKGPIVDSIRGLTAFEAEQVVAMSVDEKTVSVDSCQERKRQTIESVKGLSVVKPNISFGDLAGIDSVKDDLKRLMSGPQPPRAIVIIEEIEKCALSSPGDLSGVSKDALGTFLTYLENEESEGTLLVGIPGSGKSAVCKACAAEFGCVVIALDFSGLQGSLVGQSQANLREALRCITAIAGQNVLFVATSNSIEGLDTALKSRFPTTYFFDNASEEQRKQMWAIHMKAFGVKGKIPNDVGFSGRNIQRCCRFAYSRGISVAEAAKSVIPEAIASAEEIDVLRSQATGRYLDANRPGPYRVDASDNGKVVKRRMTRS